MKNDNEIVMDVTLLPNKRFTANGSYRQAQPFTKPNVLAVMAALGITARLNMMLGSVVLLLEGEALPPGAGYNLIADALAMVDINNHSRLGDVLQEVGERDPYHPMEDWLKDLAPAEGDPIGGLIRSVATDNELWPVYVENWLIQVVEGVCGWRDRQEKKPMAHVLTLVGEQNAGKSYWFKQLGGQWFKGEAVLHLNTSNSKDHQLSVLRHPMAELSELGGIFRKSDIDDMKSFITREEDEIRAPYDRRAVVRPRMTSFCGSVNEAEFLNDPSGSRRFWPVMVDSIDWGFSVDFEGVWAEAYRLWQEDSGFELSGEEDAVRARIAVDTHFMESAEAETVREYIRVHERQDRFPVKAMSALDVLKMLYGAQRTFNNKQKADISRTLRDILGKHRTIDGKQRCWLVPVNEFATDHGSWPDKISLKSVASDTGDPT